MHQSKRVLYNLILLGFSVIGSVDAQAQALAPVASAGAKPTALAAGKKVYDQFCAGCHGAEGKGGGHGGEAGPKPPAINTGVWKHGSTDQDLYNIIKFGIPPNYFMIPWEGQISDENIWNLVRYVRTFE